MTVKSPRWRQPTPHDQFVSITNAMLGNVSNCREGIITAEALASRSEAHVEELKSLIYFIEHPKEW